jgi:FO synthase
MAVPLATGLQLYVGPGGFVRVAGAKHGQELSPERMEALIKAAGRQPWQRTTLYAPADPAQMAKSFNAAPLSQPVMG